jgi:integrase
MALNDTRIRALKHKGSPTGEKYGDALGLYLHLKAPGKYWRMRYRFLGKQKTLSLGIYPAVSLLNARKARDAARELLAAGIDPSAAKQAKQKALRAEAHSTFEAVAKAWLAKPDAKRSASTTARNARWLEVDVFPFVGNAPIHTLTAKVMLDRVLTRIEQSGTVEKAGRVKVACGMVFRFAVVQGLITANPIDQLKGVLATVKVKSHAAITDPKALAGLLRAIDSYEGLAVTQAALKLSPLLFVRPGELRHAKWSEIDLDAALWCIPGAKMKMGQDHIVPLCTQAVDIFRELHSVTGGGRVAFPSLRKGDRVMSDNTVNKALRSLGFDKETHTGQGFRATARTILDEVLNERVDLIEHQLAHAVRDTNGRAYNRTAHLPARVAMMQRWADYLDQLRTGAKVVPILAA